jgi:hypothetical protein
MPDQNVAREWEPYKIEITQKAPAAGDVHVLQTVYHVAHVADARRIIQDGHLKAGLVHDESVLKTRRIAVTWLSANTWGHGSIYGNVQFTFPWQEVIAHRSFYWVEMMMDYHPPAYRILLTDRDLSGLTYIKSYDPSSDNGPLRKHDGAWYWNSNYTSEFMVEADIQLSYCAGLSFIDHHPSICRPLRSSCKDFKSVPQLPAGQVLAFLVGNNLHSLDHVLKQPTPNSSRILSSTVDYGVSGIQWGLGLEDDPFNGVIEMEQQRKSVIRGALALYGAGQDGAAFDLITTLRSKATFKMAVAEVINEHFGVTGWSMR